MRRAQLQFDAREEYPDGLPEDDPECEEPKCGLCYGDFPDDPVMVLGRSYCSWGDAFAGEMGWFTKKNTRGHSWHRMGRYPRVERMGV